MSMCNLRFIFLALSGGLVSSNFALAAEKGKENKCDGPWGELNQAYKKLPHWDGYSPPLCDLSNSTQIEGMGECIILPNERPSVVQDEGMYASTLDHIFLASFVYQLAQFKDSIEEGKAENTTCTDQFFSGEMKTDSPCKFKSDLQPILEEKFELLWDEDKDDDEHNVEGVLRHLYEDLRRYDQYLERELFFIGDGECETKNSIVHAIVRNAEAKRIEVVFRGTARPMDWTTNLNAIRKRWFKKLERGLPADINLHRGFANAVLGTPAQATSGDYCGYDSILEKVKKLMPDDPDYRLSVTGHSLGGATATIFAFFAASDPSLPGPVILYSFASPRVGGVKFRQTFRHLEQRGRIRHAKINNKHDKVALMPYLGGRYKHVGMDIRLDPCDAARVDYPVTDKWEKKLPDNWFKHIMATKNALLYHSPSEILRRVQSNKSALKQTTLENEYKTLWNMAVEVYDCASTKAGLQTDECH